tara:strand:- start:174 stop:1334 length:1161 start_codon:yes stop_codon:yes gene_type:complete
MIFIFFGGFIITNKNHLILFLIVNLFFIFLFYANQKISILYATPYGVKDISVVDPLLKLSGNPLTYNNRFFVTFILFGVSIITVLYKLIGKDHYKIFIGLVCSGILSFILMNDQLWSQYNQHNPAYYKTLVREQPQIPTPKPHTTNTYNIIQYKQPPPNSIQISEYKKYTPLLEDIKTDTTHSSKECKLKQKEISDLYETFVKVHEKIKRKNEKRDYEKNIEEFETYTKVPKINKNPPTSQMMQTTPIYTQPQNVPVYMNNNINPNYIQQPTIPQHMVRTPGPIYNTYGNCGGSVPIIFQPGNINNRATMPNNYNMGYGVGAPQVRMIPNIYATSVSPGLGSSVPYVMGAGMPSIQYMNSIVPPPTIAHKNPYQMGMNMGMNMGYY